MKLLHKIHQQPDHVRELIAGICTVVVVIAIGVVWARSFDHSVYAMLNPDQQNQSQAQPFFADVSSPSSLLGYIAQSFSDGKAAISSLFNNPSSVQVQQTSQQTQPQVSAYPLPVTGNR